jgi:hypothetical protein
LTRPAGVNRWQGIVVMGCPIACLSVIVGRLVDPVPGRTGQTILDSTAPHRTGRPAATATNFGAPDGLRRVFWADGLLRCGPSSFPPPSWGLRCLGSLVREALPSCHAFGAYLATFYRAWASEAEGLGKGPAERPRPRSKTPLSHGGPALAAARLRRKAPCGPLVRPARHMRSAEHGGPQC